MRGRVLVERGTSTRLLHLEEINVYVLTGKDEQKNWYLEIHRKDGGTIFFKGELVPYDEFYAATCQFIGEVEVPEEMVDFFRQHAEEDRRRVAAVEAWSQSNVATRDDPFQGFPRESEIYWELRSKDPYIAAQLHELLAKARGLH